MQVVELLNKDLKREYKITVEADDIQRKYTQKLEEISNNVKLPGFRPGKVPTNVIKQRYNDSIRAEILQQVLDQTTHRFIQDNKINLASKPKVDIVTFEEDKDLEYKISLEVFPEVTIPKVDDIEVTKFTFEIEEKDIQEALEKLAHNSKKFVTSENVKKAELGHAVLIDFVGKIDGEAFEGGSSLNFQLELGSKSFIDTFEEQLVGSQVGDVKTVKVTFPENYQVKDLAGKPAEFEVKVREIQVAELPKIDDEFAKQFRFESLDELKEKIKEQIQKDYEQAVKTYMRKELFDKLDKRCDFLIPEGMVEGEFNILWHRAEEMRASNPNFSKKTDEELKDIYLKMSKRRVRLGILLSEMGKKNDIQIDQGELRQAIYEQARHYPGQEHVVIEYYRNNPASLESLKGPLMEDKVVDLLFTQVKIKEAKSSIKEITEKATIKEDEFAID